MDYLTSRDGTNEGTRCGKAEIRQMGQVIGTRQPRCKVNGVCWIEPYVLAAESSANGVGVVAIAA
jgi:hypothetical protein